MKGHAILKDEIESFQIDNMRYVLSETPEVLFDNLIDETNVRETYRKILTQNFGDVIQRRLFIESINATWELSTKKYVEIYQKVLGM